MPYVARGYEEPVGETERALAGIWSEVLKVERVGRRDNFFDLGGHSLLGMRFISQVQAPAGSGSADQRSVRASGPGRFRTRS